MLALSRSGKSKTAESAQEHALINRFGCLGRVLQRFLLRSDNGLLFTSRSYTVLVKSYGLQQEFITPYTPEQNGMVDRVVRRSGADHYPASRLVPYRMAHNRDSEAWHLFTQFYGIIIIIRFP